MANDVRQCSRKLLLLCGLDSNGAPPPWASAAGIPPLVWVGQQWCPSPLGQCSRNPSSCVGWTAMVPLPLGPVQQESLLLCGLGSNGAPPPWVSAALGWTAMVPLPPVQQAAMVPSQCLCGLDSPSLVLGGVCIEVGVMKPRCQEVGLASGTGCLPMGWVCLPVGGGWVGGLVWMEWLSSWARLWGGWFDGWVGGSPSSAISAQLVLYGHGWSVGWRLGLLSCSVCCLPEPYWGGYKVL